MRIAVVHSFYSDSQPSGENRVVDMQVSALRSAGHDVLLCQVRTSDFEHRRTYPVKTAFNVMTGRGFDPTHEIHAFGAQVIHVHNLFPNFGRAWVANADVPLVATMHNYRLLCPAATFFRDGGVCTDCLDRRSAWSAVQHGCYRNNRLKTLPLALSTRFDSDPVLDHAALITTLSQDMSDQYARAGVDPRRLRVVNNFVHDIASVPKVADHDYWLYVGRLAREKGILDLVRGWPVQHRLLIAGSGSDESAIREAAGPSVELLGELAPDLVRGYLSNALGLLFPSNWLEGMALVCLEALSVGTPIMAWAPAPAARTVSELGVGVAAGTDLRVSLDSARSMFPSLRDTCRKAYEDLFSESAWLRSQLAVYAEAAGLEGPA